MNKEKIKKEMLKMIDDMTEGSEDFGDSIRDTIEEAKEKAAENFRDARLKTNRMIQTHPEKSVMIAAGIGALLGMGIAMIISGKCKNCR